MSDGHAARGRDGAVWGARGVQREKASYAPLTLVRPWMSPPLFPLLRPLLFLTAPPPMISPFLVSLYPPFLASLYALICCIGPMKLERMVDCVGSINFKEQWKKRKDDVLGVYICIAFTFSDDCEAYGRSISECLRRAFLALNMVTLVFPYKKVLSITSWQIIN